MPELPEVETIKNTLKKLVIGETIEHIDVHWPNIIKHPEVPLFKKRLIGQSIVDITRKGKFLVFELTKDVLISHLRMEGKYHVCPSSKALDKHTHVLFTFMSCKQLRYNDVRKFGTMHVYSKEKAYNQKPLNQLGPDPFEEMFTVDYLYKKLQKTTRAIKVALLDQTIVSGLGNIYVDEVLFKAGIHPLKRAHKITKNEAKRIHTYCNNVLRAAIEKGGTTIRSYLDGIGEMGMFQQYLFVYGQTNKPCKTCEETIIKLKVGGRGTHICPSCQQKPSSTKNP